MRIRFRKTALIAFTFLSCIASALRAQTSQVLLAEIDSLNKRFNTTVNEHPELADSLNKLALQQATELNYLKGKANATSNKGVLDFHKGNYKQAIELFFAALKLYDEDAASLHHTSEYGYTLMRMGAGFLLEKDNVRSLYYLRKAIAVANSIKDQKLLCASYRFIGNTFREAQVFDSSYHYLTAALQVATKSNHLSYILSINNDIGLYYFYNKGDYRQAIRHFQVACQYSRQLGENLSLAIGLHNVGEAYFKLGSYKEAKFYLDSAQYYGQSLNTIDRLLDTYQIKAKLYAALNNTNSTAYYYEKSLTLKDSIYNETYKKELAALQTGADVYKKETENKILLKDKRIAELYRNLAVAGIIGLGILLGFILLNQRLRIQRRVKNQLEEEVALRTTEVLRQKETIYQSNLQLKLALNGTKFDSHFVFNVLNAIQHVVLQQKPLEAQDHLAKLSRLMRYVLEKSPLERVSLTEELQIIERYIQLEQLRLDHRFTYSIDVAATDQATIPALLLQPYVENAILHGLAPATGENLVLQLQVEAANDMLTVTITDNGVGRKKEKRSGHHSLGSKIGQERLDILTHLTHKNHRVFIEDLLMNDGHSAGTKVILQIPMETQPVIYEPGLVG